MLHVCVHCLQSRLLKLVHALTVPIITYWKTSTTVNKLHTLHHRLVDTWHAIKKMAIVYSLDWRLLWIYS